MTIKVRQGETKVLRCVHTIPVGGVDTPSSIDGMTITSHVRNYQNTFIEQLTFAALPGVGEFTLTATSGQTADWPTGTLYWDIRLESPGSIVQITSKDTFEISRPVTLAEAV